MATVYKIDLELTSLNVDISPELIQLQLKSLIEGLTNFQGVEIKVERKTLEMTRKIVMSWWNELSDITFLAKMSKSSYCKKYYGNRRWNTLTGLEIQHIYESEKISY